MNSRLTPAERAELEELQALADRDELERLRAGARQRQDDEAFRAAGREAIRRIDAKLIIRGPTGRPGWSDELFGRRWRRAVRAGNLPDDAAVGDVAPYFEGLDGVRGAVHVDHLRRQHAKWRRGELPRALQASVDVD